MSQPERTRIYHFTHAKNLTEVLQTGHLYCKTQLPPGCQTEDISHYDVQRRRRAKQVGCGPGGTLHDYVPFYFAIRSPMMYVISRGGVEGYEGGTTPLVYLVSSVQRAQEAGLSFVFSDGHPTKAFSKFYDNTGDLRDKVDWEVMALEYWNDTGEDPDRSRRRQAEFLVHQAFPWEAVEFLAVRNANLKRRLDKFLFDKWPDRAKPVKIAPDWYF